MRLRGDLVLNIYSSIPSKNAIVIENGDGSLNNNSNLPRLSSTRVKTLLLLKIKVAALNQIRWGLVNILQTWVLILWLIELYYQTFVCLCGCLWLMLIECWLNTITKLRYFHWAMSIQYQNSPSKTPCCNRWISTLSSIYCNYKIWYLLSTDNHFRAHSVLAEIFIRAKDASLATELDLSSIRLINEWIWNCKL